MKSAFGSKRRARKIEVNDDEEDGSANDTSSSTEQAKTPTTTTFSSSNSARKPFKSSSLRQSIVFDDSTPDGEDTLMGGTGPSKPSFGRSTSTKKKKAASSRLSFGPGEIISGDAAEALEDNETFTPKKTTLGRRVIEHHAARSKSPFGGDEDEERPTYSKDYLQQLKSSTPTAPKDLQLNHPPEDEQFLDPSELEGAMIVDTETTPISSIPTEAEIREKKERRARLANQTQDFISLSSSSGNNDGSMLSLLPRKKKEDTRLVREDEDLGEGFDEFVDDGRVALGKKQERETRRRQKKEMADLIYAAEGGDGDDESDDSEAERRAAYEAAQTRAGMDGLHKSSGKDTNGTFTVQIPSKITPLPALNECLTRLQTTLSGMELDLSRKRKQLNDSRAEKVDIGKREVEVQDLLKQAGARYAALKADVNGVAPPPPNLEDPKMMLMGDNGTSPLVIERGLESFGNTPVVRQEVEDVG